MNTNIWSRVVGTMQLWGKIFDFNRFWAQLSTDCRAFCTC